MRSLSLGTRLALIILAGTLTTVLSVMVIAYNALVEDFEAILTEQQLSETRKIASAVDQVLQLRRNVLAEATSSLSNGQELLPLQHIVKLINRKAFLLSLFPGGLVVLDPQATAIAESTFVPGRIGTNYADRPHFREAIETRQPVISRPIIGRTSGVPLISFVAPIESDTGELLGLVSGVVNLGQTSLMPKAALAEIDQDDAIFTVIDAKNLLYIEGPKTSAFNLTPLPSPGEDSLIDAALSGFSYGVIQNEHGKKLIYAATFLQGLDWQFVRAVSRDRATAPAQASFLNFFGTSLGIAILIAVVSLALSRSATAPLARMTRRIENSIARPSDRLRLQTSGPPEVGNLARAFNRLMDEKDAISRMKDDFVSNISHELRTPLTSMNGALRLIDSGAIGQLPDQLNSMNQLALRNGERLQLLISDLLDFNKLSSGLMAISLSSEHLKPILDSAIADNQTLAHEHRVNLTGDCDESLVLTVDRHRLRQVLDNFISNAIKFSPKEGEVVLRSEITASGAVRITVSDNGDGVPEAFVPHLFERFTQAEVGSTRSIQGTGLGLAICRELATLMAGHVGYEFKGGAQFWIELPLTQCDDGSDHEST